MDVRWCVRRVQAQTTSSNSVRVYLSSLSGMLAALRERVVATALHVQGTMWTEAVPEQQRLTIQLARNSFYFSLAAVLIRMFGDQVAI